MEKQIKYLCQSVLNGSAESHSNGRIANETNNQISALKAKHEEEKEKFELEVKKLQERLNEKDDYIEFDENQYDNRKKDEGGMQKGEQFSNPIVILKRRVNRIMDINS